MKKKNLMKRFWVLPALVLVLGLAACGADAPEDTYTPADNGEETGYDADAPADGLLEVVATTTIVADLISNIGGTRVNVQYLMGPGIDPHSHVATPSDLDLLESADVIVFHGINLEERMADVLEGMGERGWYTLSTENAIDASRLLYEEEMILEFYAEDEDEEEYEEDKLDPHIWFDALLWADVGTYFANRLAEIAPEDADYFLGNYAAHRAELEELHAYILERVEEIAPENRVLITAHDAFQYFSQAYGFTALGVQGMSTTTEASTADIAVLADFVVAQGVPAIFVETTVNPRNMEALQEAVASRGYDVVIGGELYADALGLAADGTNTFITMMRANINTIVNALAE